MRVALAALAAFLVTVGAAGADPVCSPFTCKVVWPPAPINLHQTGATEDSISLAWDEPVVPAFLSATSERPTQLVISWEPAVDSSGIDHYTVEKPSGKILGVTSLTSWPVSVLRRTNSYRVCVYATTVRGETGAPNCATYTRDSYTSRLP